MAPRPPPVATGMNSLSTLAAGGVKGLVVRLAARVRPGVGAAGGDVPPVVAAVVQRQLEDAEGAVLAGLAVGSLAFERLGQAAPRPPHELPDSGRVGVAGAVLAGEALVDVPVTGEDEVGAAGLEVTPDVGHPGVDLPQVGPRVHGRREEAGVV